mgnify:CR=1 FL=1
MGTAGRPQGRVWCRFGVQRKCGFGAKDDSRGLLCRLGARPTATAGEIRSRYLSLIAQYHPDKVAHLGAKLQMLAERETKLLNEAYQALKV